MSNLNNYFNKLISQFEKNKNNLNYEATNYLTDVWLEFVNFR